MSRYPAQEAVLRERRLLTSIYPNAKIFTHDGEIIVELEPGRALAVIWRSEPHWHRRSVEQYEIVHGLLAVHVAGTVTVLSAASGRGVLRKGP